jgi:hypothetical protein
MVRRGSRRGNAGAGRAPRADHVGGGLRSHVAGDRNARGTLSGSGRAGRGAEAGRPVGGGPARSGRRHTRGGRAGAVDAAARAHVLARVEPDGRRRDVGGAAPVVGNAAVAIGGVRRRCVARVVRSGAADRERDGRGGRDEPDGGAHFALLSRRGRSLASVWRTSDAAREVPFRGRSRRGKRRLRVPAHVPHRRFAPLGVSHRVTARTRS